MTKIEEIERAIEHLAPGELVKFRAWYETFDAAQFDAKIERDATSGKLDRLAEQALSGFREGRTREI